MMQQRWAFGAAWWILCVAAWLCAGSRLVGAQDQGLPRTPRVTFLTLADVAVIGPVDGGRSGGIARIPSIRKELSRDGR